MNALVSVIIPVFNGEATVAQTIDSILKQDYKNIELLVINDGSTDDSEKKIKAIADDRIKYFSQRNTGNPAGPRNMGLREAAGNFIAFCDQDDIWSEAKISKQLEAYEVCPEKEKVGIIFSSSNQIDKDGKVINELMAMGGFVEQQEANKRLLFGNFITACSAVVPKKVINETGFLNEDLTGNDEYEMWLRITEKYGILGVRDVLCSWRQTGLNLSKNKTKLYLENEKIFNRLREENDSVRIGHGKNISRIIIASIIEEEDKTAEEYIEKSRNYPVSKKMKLFRTINSVSNNFSFRLIRFLNKIKRISI